MRALEAPAKKRAARPAGRARYLSLSLVKLGAQYVILHYYEWVPLLRDVKFPSESQRLILVATPACQPWSCGHCGTNCQANDMSVSQWNMQTVQQKQHNRAGEHKFSQWELAAEALRALQPPGY